LKYLKTSEMKNKELKIVVPVYNEQEIITTVIKKWTKLLSDMRIDYEFRVYNDGSKDNTLEVLRSLESQYPNLKIIDKKNSGHGPTILKGYKESMDAEWVFQIDSDDEIDVTYFPELWNNREQYDFLIGKRMDRNTPAIRKLISLISRLTISALYGNRVYDVNCPYRLMRTSAVKSFILDIPDDTLAPNLIIAGMASRKRLAVFQTEVHFKFRTTGEVSIKRWKLLKFSIKSFWQTFTFRF